MVLFILTETSAGFALLKAKGSCTSPWYSSHCVVTRACCSPVLIGFLIGKKLLQKENLGSEIETAEQICSL